MNSVCLTGRLGNDPESFAYGGDKTGAKFRLAVQRDRENTDWFDVSAYEPTARFVNDYMRKGALVAVEGRLQSRTWERQDGSRAYAVEVVAFRVEGMESRAEREAREEGSNQPRQQPKRQDREEADPPDWAMDENDDPFGDQ